MTARRWGLLVLAGAGLFWALGGEWASIHRGVSENHFLDALAGGGFFVAGLVALDRRPGNRLGPLMLATGASWFCGNWQSLDWPVWAALLVLGNSFSVPLVVHIALAYPTGRLATRFERVTVAAVYIATVGTIVGFLATDDPRVADCTRNCPWAPVMWSSQPAANLFTRANHLTYVLAPLFIAALLLRWRRSSTAQRRYLAPLWIASAILAVVYVLRAFSSRDDSHGFAYLLSEFQSALQICLPAVFLAGLLSARLAQSAVGDLVVRLQAPLPSGELRGLLTTVLGDPSMNLVYALDGTGRWITAEGMAAELPTSGTGRDARHVTIVERNAGPLAALIHDPAVDPELARAAAAAAGMALENERLHAQVRRQLEEVRASRSRIVQAGDDERRKVERDLHDGAQQRLVALALALHTGRRQLTSGRTDILADTLARACEELRLALDELRALAHGIHPVILTDEGLGPALRSLADRASVPVTLGEVPNIRFPGTVEATAYFVVSEALANVGKHAHASRATVCVTHDDVVLTVEVADDGCGGADVTRGSGLRGLYDRVAAVNGHLIVTSRAEHGTTLTATLPGAPREDP
jgi:signal transduction histidine kinase